VSSVDDPAPRPSDASSAGPRLKLLFVCSRNRKRSLTAEEIYRGSARYDVRSAGTQPEARVRLTAGLIGWADVLFFMERSHLNRAAERFSEELNQKSCHVLNLPDDYEFMDPELIDILETAVATREEW
jgi:predicted protein tyrosine phosphatase